MKRWMVVAAAVSMLSGCGGGDGDSPLGSQGGLGSDGVGGGGVVTPPPGGGGSTTRNSAGLWIGTADRDGSDDPGPMLMLITETGEIAAWALPADLSLDFFGQASGSGTNFSAEVTTYSDFAPAPETTFEGTVTSGESLSGSYTFGTSSGTFDLLYSDTYQRSASLSKIAGVYSDTSSTPAIAITIQANGSLSGNITDTCTIEGNVSVPRADRNYYRFDGELVGCGSSFSGDMSGLIFLDDSSASTTDDLLVLMGQTDNNSTSVYLDVTK